MPEPGFANLLLVLGAFLIAWMIVGVLFSTYLLGCIVGPYRPRKQREQPHPQAGDSEA